ncbi:unknown [Clostridium sp. CAG:269]|nr:unknown [Clostridium sp. CAG:269]
MEQNIKKINRSIKIQPLFSAFSDDLIFLVPIDTLFLTITKGLNASQIQFMTMLSLMIGILSRRVLLNLSNKIGNIKSLRLGSLLLLISAIIITFGKQPIIIYVYRVVYELAFMFLAMSLIVLKDNLQYINKGNEYFKIRNKTKILYSTTTMVTALLSGYLFNLNNYLPLFAQIVLCLIMFIMSFLLYDVETESKNNDKVKKDSNIVKKFVGINLLIILSFAISTTIVKLGQNNSKLFMQYDFQKFLSTEMVTYYITIIVFISRIARLLGNVVFGKVYKKANDRMNIIITVFLTLAFVLLIIGHYINFSFVYKVIIMSTGFFLILATRDSFKLYLEDIALENTKKEKQKKILIDMQVYMKVFSLIGSAIFTLILLKYELIVLEFILLGMCIIELCINSKLYKLLKTK